MKKPAPKPVREIVEGPFEDAGLLPARVASMREKILEACASGDIDKLRPAIERNEVMPLFGRAGDRPKNFAVALEFLRARSFDGKGRETLLLLEAVFSAPFVKITRGPHVGFHWPAFAHAVPSDANVEQRAAMLRCVRFADMLGNAAPPYHRGEIGEDGTWHAFGTS